MNYTEKENKIIYQTKNGPYHTKIISLSYKEFNDFVDKLISNKEYDTLLTVLAIYVDYDSEKVFDYFLEHENTEYLIRVLNIFNDFGNWTKWDRIKGKTTLNGRFIVDEIILKSSPHFAINFLNSNDLYFLTSKEIEEAKNQIKL